MIAPGQHVLYASAPYEVKAVHGDLLELVGRTVIYRDINTGQRYARCRESCTVLASDVVGDGREGE